MNFLEKLSIVVALAMIVGLCVGLFSGTTREVLGNYILVIILVPLVLYLWGHFLVDKGKKIKPEHIKWVKIVNGAILGGLLIILGIDIFSFGNLFEISPLSIFFLSSMGMSIYILFRNPEEVSMREVKITIISFILLLIVATGFWSNFYVYHTIREMKA